MQLKNVRYGEVELPLHFFGFSWTPPVTECDSSTRCGIVLRFSLQDIASRNLWLHVEYTRIMSVEAFFWNQTDKICDFIPFDRTNNLMPGAVQRDKWQETLMAFGFLGFQKTLSFESSFWAKIFTHTFSFFIFLLKPTLILLSEIGSSCIAEFS